MMRCFPLFFLISVCWYLVEDVSIHVHPVVSLSGNVINWFSYQGCASLIQVGLFLPFLFSEITYVRPVLVPKGFCCLTRIIACRRCTEHIPRPALREDLLSCPLLYAAKVPPLGSPGLQQVRAQLNVAQSSQVFQPQGPCPFKNALEHAVINKASLRETS